MLTVSHKSGSVARILAFGQLLCRLAVLQSEATGTGYVTVSNGRRIVFIGQLVPK